MAALTSGALARNTPEHEADESAADDALERLELEFEAGFGALDSDDIEALIGSGAVWMPSDERRKP